ncbi:hypothetical protein C9J27_26095, partial [Photobacterium kishitanii]
MLLKTCVIKRTVVFITLVLAGCGGDSSSDVTPIPTPTPTPTSKLVTLDGFSTVKPDIKTLVNLSSFVRGDNVKIVSVTAEDDDTRCSLPTVNGIGLDITAEPSTYCNYSYLVKSGDVESRAQLSVLATEAAVPMLPPVSKAIILGEGDLSLNLKTLLGANWPIGYHLNSSSTKVQGSGNNIGSIASVTENTIVYKGPELSGWNRIVYTVSNPLKPDEDKMGTVYVTVSEYINHPPKIGIPKYSVKNYYDPNIKEPMSYDVIYDSSSGNDTFFTELTSLEGMTSQLNRYNTIHMKLSNFHFSRNIYLPNGKEYDGKFVVISRSSGYTPSVHFNGFRIGIPPTVPSVFVNKDGIWFTTTDTLITYNQQDINLSMVPIGIIEPDGQDWHIVDVQSASAIVKPKHSSSLTNKTFSFNSTAIGKNYVSYIIGDNYGGYSSGLLEFDLKANELGSLTWYDLSLADGTKFIAPIRYSEGVQTGVSVWPLWTQGTYGGLTAAGYSPVSAKAYCNTIGSLPTKKQMDNLRETHGKDGSGSLNLWPKDKYYIQNSDGVISTYNIVTGVVTPYSGGHFYTTCVRNTHLNLTMLQTEVIANGERQVIAK